MPSVKTALALEAMTQGQVLLVLTDDPVSRRDLPVWAEATGNTLVGLEEDGADDKDLRQKGLSLSQVGKVYHLDLDKNAIQGAEIALLPGDPARSPLIAGAIAEAYETSSSTVASKREFTTCLTEVMGKKILVTSTGIGGPSTSIAVDELAQLGSEDLHKGRHDGSDTGEHQ